MIYPILDQDCRALLSLVTFTTLCLLSCSLQVTWGEYKLIAMRRVACFQENGENLDSWIILDGEEWLSNERRELTAVDITLLGKWHRLENTADKTDERWMKSWAVFLISWLLAEICQKTWEICQKTQKTFLSRLRGCLSYMAPNEK